MVELSQTTISLIGSNLIKGNEPASNDTLVEVKAIGLYCAGYWCPPCKMLTPVLIDFYNEVNKDYKQFEVIYLSCDKDENQFKEYFGTMPWLAIPYSELSLVNKIKEKHNIKGLPTLFVIKPDDTVISINAKGEVFSIGPDCFQEWIK